MKKILTLSLALFTCALVAQTKVDLSTHGLNATITIPSEYGEAKVDSSVYSSFTTWSIKAGKNFKVKIKAREKKAGMSPEQLISAGKKELAAQKGGKVVFVKYAVEEKNAVIIEMKHVETNVTNFTMVYYIEKGNKIYEITSGLSAFTEADCKAMLTAVKGMTWQ